MCAIFGFIDLKNAFSEKDRSTIVKQLSVHSQIRGTDATGFAYNSKDSLNIVKRPVPAYKMKLKLPKDSNVVVGHTRMTTQGNEKRNYNNHPFAGKVDNTRFALVHNGMISNDAALRKQYRLPKSKIETDTYIAVQLIEHQHQLDFESLRFMSEQVTGIFTFALLDSGNNVWVVKGDNPVSIYYNKKFGFYIFASTKEILNATLKSTGLQKLHYEEIPVSHGEMLKIAPDSSIQRSTFELPYHSYVSKFSCYGDWDDYSWYYGFEDAAEIVQLKEAARMFGVYEDEVEAMLEFGYLPEEIEAMLNSPYEFKKALKDASYEEDDYLLGGY